MAERELSALRGEIDRVDREMTALFLERLALVDEIGALKKARGLPVRDEAREAAILERACERGGAEAEALFRALLAISRARQEREANT